MQQEADHLLYEHLNSSKDDRSSEKGVVAKGMPEFGEMLRFVHEGCCTSETGLETKFKFGDQNLLLYRYSYVKVLSNEYSSFSHDLGCKGLSLNCGEFSCADIVAFKSVHVV